VIVFLIIGFFFCVFASACVWDYRRFWRVRDGEDREHLERLAGVSPEANPAQWNVLRQQYLEGKIDTDRFVDQMENWRAYEAGRFVFSTPGERTQRRREYLLGDQERGKIDSMLEVRRRYMDYISDKPGGMMILEDGTKVVPKPATDPMPAPSPLVPARALMIQKAWEEEVRRRA
jgi:hypothetical protein